MWIGEGDNPTPTDPLTCSRTPCPLLSTHWNAPCNVTQISHESQPLHEIKPSDHINTISHSTGMIRLFISQLYWPRTIQTTGHKCPFSRRNTHSRSKATESACGNRSVWKKGTMMGHPVHDREVEVNGREEKRELLLEFVCHFFNGPKKSANTQHRLVGVDHRCFFFFYASSQI